MERYDMSNIETIQKQQELIPQELIQKFDGDKELVQEFLEQGYTQEDLTKSSVIHATKMDPLCVLEDGTNAGMWLYADNNHHSNKGVLYSDLSFQNFKKRFEFSELKNN